jgi:protein TonB
MKDLLLRHKKHIPVAIGVLVVLLVAIVAFVFRDAFEKPVQGKKQIQQIAVIQAPPPPPPPPPPPEMKPPEVKEEKIEQPEPEPEPPEPQAAEPPPGEDLGVDSDGSAGADGFGLVGKKGGSGLIGGGGGNALIFYGQHVQRELTDELHQNLKDKARNSKYTAVLHIWISPNGDISKVELANSSGTAEIDEALRAAVSRIHGRLKPPPERMPQPLKIRIRS